MMNADKSADFILRTGDGENSPAARPLIPDPNHGRR